ncbi:MAG: nuclear transport factor 2 family protein [Saprospiraceae bacterium]|nr:nuclear transport factor 2 family protein [Saprospiraceae bacterium]
MQSAELIKQYYACFNQKDWAGMLALLDPEIRHEVNQGEVRIGVDLYAQFLQQMDEAYEETLHDLVYMINEAGNRIAVEFVVHGIYKKGGEGLPPAHGQTYILPAGAFLEVKNRKICRVTTYYNLPLWIKLVEG